MVSSAAAGNAAGTTAGTTPSTTAATTNTSSCPPANFSDVRAGSTYHAPVSWMVCEGLTKGYADGSFGAGRDISRAETAAFLYRYVQPSFTAPARSPFADVPSGSGWSYAPITWLHSEGIVGGYADGGFKPGQSITRGEMAKILYGAADPDYTAPATSAFKDVPAGSSFHRHISWMKHVGATSGYADGTYKPSRKITRGEMSMLLWKIAPHLDRTAAPAPKPAPAPAPKQFTVRGAGWGHGVGMSQYGAAAMARGGHNVTQILQFYYNPATVQNSTVRAADNIRVHLHSTAQSTIEGTGQVRVRTGSTTRATAGAVRFAAERGQVSITMPDGTKSTQPTAILEWTGTRFWAGAATTVRVPQADGGARPLDLRHGRLVISVINGQLNIVNELRMTDEYLYGLTEIPASWPAAALQAQAVAGRSYALRNMSSVKAACDCHVWDEVRSQKFTGWGKENERIGTTHWGSRWTAAVNATVTRTAAGAPTSALSLWHGGSVADATYYSSNGGHTRSNQNVWSGSAVPYLQARPDPYSTSAAANNPHASWTATLTQDQLARAFGLQDVVSVSITRGSDLTAASLTARSRNGQTAQLTGTQFRAKLSVRSAWVESIVPQ